MKQVMNHNKDNGLLNMIRRTDTMILSHGARHGVTPGRNVFEFFFQKGSNNLVLSEILPIFAP